MLQNRLTEAPLLVMALLLGSACSNDSTGPSTAPATALVSVAPTNGTVGVSPAGAITVGFNGAMKQGMEQYVDLHRGDATGPVHPTTCAWSADRSTLTCTPTSRLQSGTHYTLHLGGGMLGATGGVVDMDPGSHMGGEWVHNDNHGGEPWSMMGPDWHGANGAYGMTFWFQTG